MTRVLRAGSGLLLLAATSASGGGVNLTWNDCYPTGQTNKAFACDTNAGSNVLVASFDPPNGVARLVGGSAVIELEGAAAVLPSWWLLSSSGCRTGSLTLDFPEAGSCADAWSGAATGSFTYDIGYLGVNTARILISWGIPEALAGPVESGTEYYAFRLTLDNSKTVGAGACAGCQDPACIILSAVWLYQVAGLGDHLLCTPRVANYLSWQGGAVLPCPGFDSPPGDCNATPTHRRSWGLIKGLYR